MHEFLFTVYFSDNKIHLLQLNVMLHNKVCFIFYSVKLPKVYRGPFFQISTMNQSAICLCLLSLIVAFFADLFGSFRFLLPFSFHS